MKTFQNLALLLVAFLALTFSQDAVTETSDVVAEVTPNAEAVPVTETSTESNPPATAQRPRLGLLQVPLKISGQEFTVRFSPELKSSEDVASQICTDQADQIGVTHETYDNCVKNVGAYLQGSIDDWLNEKTLRFPININQTEFSLRFIPEMRDAKNMAAELCSQYSQATGLTFETEADCINPVQQLIQRRINNFYSEKSLEVSVTINEKHTFDISFLPERRTPVEVATNLCVEYAQLLELTEETVRPNCIVPVGNFLLERVESWVRSKTLEFTFQVNQKPYTVAFLPERTSATQVAQEFCVRNAEPFQLTNENVIKNCISPMSEFFQRTVAQWVEDRRAIIPVDFKGKTVNIAFLPERQNILSVARNVCRQQVESLGLTDENFTSDCVNPLSSVLRQGLTQWVNDRQRQLASQRQTSGTEAAASTTQSEPAAAPAV